ncbi:MAG TPA: MinD/ParA family protein [Clostridiales bacterium]|nr:MinD/ParA family protein [Clostridiales bacterium]
MNDQAAQLREIVKKSPSYDTMTGPMAKIITITSGKGGVGKSNTVINIALSLRNLGKKVIILDADLGLANIEVLLGIIPDYNLSNVLNGKKNILEIIEQNEDGISFISGGSGIRELMFLTQDQITHFANSIAELEKIADFILIDTSAGITEAVLSFCKLAHEVVFITTPEPTSITDAYALIKTFQGQYGEDLPLFKLLINKSETANEAQQVYTKLSSVCKHFLSIDIQYMGFIPFDYNIMRAAKLQKPISKCYPKSSASIAYQNIAESLIEVTVGKDDVSQKNNFFKQVINMFVKK